jgi:hypothetical protein
MSFLVLRSCGMILRSRWPIISGGGEAEDALGALFHDVTMPSSVLLTIASSDDSTIAASIDLRVRRQRDRNARHLFTAARPPSGRSGVLS